MFEKKKKEKETSEDLTMQEAIVELGKSMKTINSRLDVIEKPKEVKPETTPETTPETKPEVIQVEPKFMVYDQPIKHKRVIIDNTDKENPLVLDIESALSKILNDVAALKKALA